ncbi:hypothetical protein B9Z55_025656 [Caenorhabditis nigoni]|nr:hypothetical protein B9Z55_025656 [Caenorhabditis nigoni]
MSKPPKLAFSEFYTRFDVYAHGLNVFRSEAFSLIDRLTDKARTVEEHDKICSRALLRAKLRMEYAIDSGFEEVEDKDAGRLEEVKRVIYNQCFKEGRKFFDMYTEHTREALDEDMKHIIFCRQHLKPYEETEKTRNRWKRQEKIFKIHGKSANAMLERLQKDRLYEDSVLADIHASAIDEFRVKMVDYMEEAITTSLSQSEFNKICENVYRDAYEFMKKEIDFMFASLEVESIEARQRSCASKDMVIKRCRVESLIFNNRYLDYWADMLHATKENRDINDFDADPRLMMWFRESRERVRKRKAERAQRQAKLDLTEKLKSNFNCEDPKNFWKTSAQKESDQKSPAAVQPIMRKFNNMACRPEVELTISEEVQNQFEKYVQEKRNAACSDAQNFNDGAPEKKNEHTGKEVLELTENLKRIFNCEDPKSFWKTSAQKKFNNVAYRPEVEGTIAEEVRNQYENHVREKMHTLCLDAKKLDVGAPKTEKKESQKEVNASVQSSHQGSSTQKISRAERAQRLKTKRLQRAEQVRNNTSIQNLQRRREENAAALPARMSNQNAQPSIQNRESVRPPSLRGCSDVEKLNVGAPKTKKEETRKKVKAPVQPSQQESSSQKSSKPQRKIRPRSAWYLLELRRRKAEADDVARLTCVSNQDPQPSTHNQQSVHTFSQYEADILITNMNKCYV